MKTATQYYEPAFRITRHAFAVSLLATAMATTLPQARASDMSPAPELFTPERHELPIGSGQSRTEARIAVGTGYVEFVRHVDGSVGVGIVGLPAKRAVDIYVRRFDATPLELFKTLAPAGAIAPQSLVADHATRARLDSAIPSTPRTFPGMGSAKLFVTGSPNWNGPWYPDPLCAINSYMLWEFTFADPYENTNIDWAGHAWGHGTWTGDANITLGSSSAGTLMVCPPPDLLPDEDPGPGDIYDVPIRAAVHEYVAQEGWHQIWSVNTVELGSVVAYSYKGYVVRKLRMTVRDFERFYWWAAAY